MNIFEEKPSENVRWHYPHIFNYLNPIQLLWDELVSTYGVIAM